MLCPTSQPRPYLLLAAFVLAQFNKRILSGLLMSPRCRWPKLAQRRLQRRPQQSGRALPRSRKLSTGGHTCRQCCVPHASRPHTTWTGVRRQSAPFICAGRSQQGAQRNQVGSGFAVASATSVTTFAEASSATFRNKNCSIRERPRES